MGTNLLLTVVLPTFNRLDKLKISLPTILKTKRQDVQFLILDNNSTDGTSDFIKKQMLNDSRIQLITHSKNLHINLNTFEGFKRVRSPYAMWLADDDIIEGDYIEKCIEIFEKYPSISLVHNRVNNLSLNKEVNEFEIFSKGREAIIKIFTRGSSFPGLCYRMSCFDLDEYPQDEKKIYCLVKMNLLIAKKYDIAITNKSGLKSLTEQTKNNLKDIIFSQRRSSDYNVGEILSYAKGFVEDSLFVLLCQKLTPWVLEMAKHFANEDYQKFIKSISKNLGSYYFPFLIKLLFVRFDIKIIYYLLINLININNYKYHFFTLVLIVKKITYRIIKF